MINVGVISYSAGALLFLVLTLLLLTSWRGRLQGALLLAACVASTVWCAALAVYSAHRTPSFTIIELLEIAKNGAWLVFLLKVLGYAKTRGDEGGSELRLSGILIVGVCLVLAVFVTLEPHLALDIAGETRVSVMTFGHVLLAVAGLALVEQLYRNTREEHRWAIKLLCLGVGGMFAYDFFLYSHALLFKQLSMELWDARGAINAITVPLIAVSAARNPNWSLDIFVSRHVVFHSAALLGAGVYLMLMAAVGYYIRIFGGTWGGVAQAVFLFGAVVLLLLLLFSAQLRARTKVFFNKHFFKNKYDYREEWLLFTQLLSSSGPNEQLRENIIRAIAEIVDSPGGVMWMRQETGQFLPVATRNMAVPGSPATRHDSSLIRFLVSKGWVLFIDEFRRKPDHYQGLELPDWLQSMEGAWLVVPLLQGDELLGFVVVARSNSPIHLNWEDNDLLKTVGRQAASYLALQKADEALTDARQFEAFNRLSAYVVHDLKNLVAQLSLIGTNAKKHMHNPAFVEDAVNTVENAAAKMNRLLAQLRKGHEAAAKERPVSLRDVLDEVVRVRSANRPVPVLYCPDEDLTVTVDRDRLAAVLEHLVQNAQEATPVHGSVIVRLAECDGAAVIEVEDSGCGMNHEFIAERLFRPFDTTKGNAGMGIGVYEAREFLHAQGGVIDVRSQPGTGTTFRVQFPLRVGEERLVHENHHAEMAS